MLDLGETPKSGWCQFKQVVKSTFKGELIVGLWVTFREMINALFRGQMHTV
jgi:NADH-quinone oxidoreductase subunit I